MKNKVLALVCLLCALPAFGQVYISGGLIAQQDLNAASPTFATSIKRLLFAIPSSAGVRFGCAASVFSIGTTC